MRNLILSVTLGVLTLAAQTSNYPSSLDTNSSLFATADNVATVLTYPMLAADNVAIVQSSTGFAVNQIATICEAQKASGTCTSWEHMLVTAVNGNVLTVTRAFAGTSAVPHSVGKAVAVLIDAAHQSALKSAVVAIETALGANLANVPGSSSGAAVPPSKGGTGVASPAAHGVAVAEGSSPYNYVTPGASGTVLMSNGASADPSYQSVQALPAATAQLQYVRTKPNSGNLSTYEFATAAPVLRAADYTFSQTPGGTLSVGSNTITLTPCPLGVSGSDVNHQLYFSAGSGTAEVAAITGGTCSGDGVTTGTITVSLGNSHSGAWTVTSATFGQQEAEKVLKAAGKGGTIQLGQGVFTMCGTVTVDTDGITIAGVGSIGTGPNATSTPSYGASGTQIVPCSANQILYNVPYGHYGGSVGMLSIEGLGFYNNGLAGITAIKTIHDNYTRFTNLNFAGTTNAMYGLYLDRSMGTVVSNVTSTGTAGSFFGSSTDNTSGDFPYGSVNITNWQYIGTAAALSSVTFQRCVGCGLTHARFSDVTNSESGTAIQILNDCQGDELEDVGSEQFRTAISIASNTVGSTTIGPGWTTITDAQLDGGQNYTGISIGAGAYEVAIINPTFTAVTSAGIAIQATGVVSSHAVMRLTGGYFGLTQPLADISLVAPITGVSIVGATFNSGAPGSDINITGSGNASDLMITGNTLLATAGIVVIGPTLVNSHIVNNACDSSGGAAYCNGGYTGNLTSVTYANLPAAPNGTVLYCSNCNSTCTAGSSTGRTCYRENGAWTH